jgi:hypothetical protein
MRTVQLEDVIRRDLPGYYAISATFWTELDLTSVHCDSFSIYFPSRLLDQSYDSGNVRATGLIEALAPLIWGLEESVCARAQQTTLIPAASTGAGRSIGESSRASCPV